MEADKETPEGATATKSTLTAYLECVFSKKFDAIQSMVERLQQVAPPIRKINPNTYADTPFADEIASIEMPIKSSFPA